MFEVGTKPVMEALLNGRELAELVGAMGADVGVLLAVMPNGQAIALCSTDPGNATARQFNRTEQHPGSPTLVPLYDGKPIESPVAAGTAVATGFEASGLTSMLVAPISPVLFPQYPAAIALLFRSAEPGPLSRFVGLLSERRLNDTAGVTPSVIVLNPDGTTAGRSVGFDQDDPDVAAQLARLAVKPPAKREAGARVYVNDVTGEITPWRRINLNDPQSGDRVRSIFCKVPAWSEFAALKPADFAAAPDLAALIPAIKYMVDLHADGITLPDVARAVHLSPFHFHRRFSNLVGITPKHLLFDIQIDHAKRLLLEATVELADIAKRCGFAHQSHFTSRFKQATGLTPTRWRQIHTTSVHQILPVGELNARAG